jgi:hypothetical protein
MPSFSALGEETGLGVMVIVVSAREVVQPSTPTRAPLPEICPSAASTHPGAAVSELPFQQ